MKYFGYMPNDFINGEGVCVSLWTAGCPHKCLGCHNAEMWDYNNGFDVPSDLIEQLCSAISDNNILRNFSILGGEPLSPENQFFTAFVISEVRKRFPNIKIYLWTGYTYEELQKLESQSKISHILSLIDILIEGRFVLSERDITLKLRGSSNQRIIDMKKTIAENRIVEYN